MYYSDWGLDWSACLATASMKRHNFALCVVTDSRTFFQVLKDAYNGNTPLSQAEQLAHAVAQQDIKVCSLFHCLS